MHDEARLELKSSLWRNPINGADDLEYYASSFDTSSVAYMMFAYLKPICWHCSRFSNRAGLPKTHLLPIESYIIECYTVTPDLVTFPPHRISTPHFRFRVSVSSRSTFESFGDLGAADPSAAGAADADVPSAESSISSTAGCWGLNMFASLDRK
jgi:hypothetical protein